MNFLKMENSAAVGATKPYIEKNRPGGYIDIYNLRPHSTEGAVTLTVRDGRPVFHNRSYLGQCNSVVKYTPLVEKQRRMICDSALGEIMADNLGFSSQGWITWGLHWDYMDRHRRRKLKKFFSKICAYSPNLISK